MLRGVTKNAITLESNLSKNIATDVAWFVMPKIYMLKKELVMYK